MPFDPEVFLDENTSTFPKDRPTIPGPLWVPVNEHACSFQPSHFLDVALNLIKNPNINSSNLFRADILYDSPNNELTDEEVLCNGPAEVEPWMVDDYGEFDGFKTSRCIVRQLIPRNPQLDRPIAQTCLILERNDSEKVEEIIIVLLPHVKQAEDLPWYHPAVQALAYWYQAPTSTSTTPYETQEQQTGKVSVHYQLFSEQKLPLDKRLLRTARGLLQVIYKHGQGSIGGYEKKGQHDQIISQKRVQDTYTELKAKHAKRLCSAWVEQTEPSKHVFEDLGIAAYLIELWKDMYALPDTPLKKDQNSLPPFPGFIDIGCGNGVLTEVLILSGYAGEGYDARRRKTWSILSPKTQAHLHEKLCVPQPLLDLYPASPTTTKPSLLARARSMLSGSERAPGSELTPPTHPWHNGLPAPGTFIISNHADELTPWTPLLACLSGSPFLAIPCCSHNLSGARFRAPTAYNAYSADAAAPGYFAAQKQTPTAKSVPITIPLLAEDDDEESVEGSRATAAAMHKNDAAPETGDLRALAPVNRAKQPSAYASLCDWVAHLARAVGYVVERDMLRIPSTRNIGLVGRMWAADAADAQPVAGFVDTPVAREARAQRVRAVVAAEGADGVAWVRRCEEVLAKGGGVVHGRE